MRSISSRTSRSATSASTTWRTTPSLMPRDDAARRCPRSSRRRSTGVGACRTGGRACRACSAASSAAKAFARCRLTSRGPAPRSDRQSASGIGQRRPTSPMAGGWCSSRDAAPMQVLATLARRGWHPAGSTTLANAASSSIEVVARGRRRIRRRGRRRRWNQRRVQPVDDGVALPRRLPAVPPASPAAAGEQFLDAVMTICGSNGLTSTPSQPTVARALLVHRLERAGQQHHRNVRRAADRSLTYAATS